MQIHRHVIALPGIGGQEDSSCKHLTLFHEDRRLQEAPHLVPMGKRFRGRGGQPHGLLASDEGHIEPEEG